MGVWTWFVARPFSCRRCTFEQGVSKIVAAHLALAERRAESNQKKPLPKKLKQAQESRLKLTDISYGKIVPQTKDLLIPKGDEDEVSRGTSKNMNRVPRMLLDAAKADVEKAHFVGKGDASLVQHMLTTFEWVMGASMRTALERAKYGKSVTVDPQELLTKRRSLHQSKTEVAPAQRV